MTEESKIPKRGEVWFVEFPYEEDQTRFSIRPVIVLEDNEDEVGVLSIKVTKHKPRDEWDYEIFKWQEAKLKLKSTARVSKALYLSLQSFKDKIGDLHNDDLLEVDRLFNEYISSVS